MSILTRWSDTVLVGGEAGERWQDIFDAVGRLMTTVDDARELEQTLDAADRILSDAAWDLWEAYADEAPRAVSELQSWWGNDGGRAILLLDALSVREARIILGAAATRGITPKDALVRGAEIPTDTGAYARALGLQQRSQLQRTTYPSSFVLAAEQPYTDVPTGVEWQQLALTLPLAPRIFLWDPWLDDMLHTSATKPQPAKRVAETATAALQGDSFWQLVDSLRQGRELLITADHGYAIPYTFVELPQPWGEQMKAVFGAGRSGDVSATLPRLASGQPLVVRADRHDAVIGQWKWKVQGGYPHIAHGGLTLAEVCIPMIIFEER